MSRRRAAGNPADRAADKPVKLTVSLPADLARRFGVHAEMMGVGKSDLFAELVKAGCRRFVVHDRGTGPGASSGPEAAEQGRGAMSG
jgi:hypothetical protein